MHRYIALVALFAAATSAHAGELGPYRGESIELGSIRGVTYYTEAPSGYRVVTTLADGEAGLPLRFEATLADNQRLVISVPGKLGEQSIALEISRAGDKLILSRAQALEEELAVSRPQVPSH
jgi:hypothetical protein